jgi:hypothetical protein
MASTDFESADKYIMSPNVASLMVSSEDVHSNLWHLFQQLLATTDYAANVSGWQYGRSFTYAVDSIKKEYTVNNGDILENTKYQHRMCFHFIMHIHH